MISATTDAVLLIILSVTLALAAAFLPRHPLVLAWMKRRDERRILAAPRTRPAVRLPARPCPRVPGHETYLLTPAEEDVFAEVADELKGLEYQWIPDALRGRREAGQ